MATPTLVQHCVFGTNSNFEASKGQDFLLPIHNSTLSNNCLVLKIFGPNAITWTITDNATGGTNSWPTVTASVADAGNSIALYVFVFPGAYGGVSQIKVHGSAAVYGFCAAFQEWTNVATSSVTDGSHTAQPQSINSGAGIASGSFNTTVDGDVILHFFQCDDSGQAGFSGIDDGMSKITAASGYTLLQADIVQGYGCEYLVQTTHGATNPSATATFTATGTFWTSITVALKAAAAGTAPPPAQTRAIGKYHVLYSRASGTHNISIQFPSFGNTFLAMCSQANNSGIAINSITGSVSGSWTVVSGSLPAGAAQGAYKISGTPGPTDILTFNITSTGAAAQGIMWDIVNGGAFGQAVGLSGATNYGPGNTAPVAPITPVFNQGVVVSVMGLFTGPPNALVTPAGGNFCSVYYTNETDLSTMDSGDAHGIYNYFTNALQNWVYYDTQASTGFQSLLIEIGLAQPIIAWIK